MVDAVIVRSSGPELVGLAELLSAGNNHGQVRINRNFRVPWADGQLVFKYFTRDAVRFRVSLSTIMKSDTARLTRGSLAATLILLACALTHGAQAKARAAARPPAVTVREPEIRHLDPEQEQDHADLQRIWHFRNKLPEQYRWRNNFAWAVAEIKGLDKKEYFAHSSIQGPDELSAKAARSIKGMSYAPAKGTERFTTLFVDYQGNIDGPDAIPRWFDTEYKILEDIAARLPDPSAAGHIRLYTNLEPCPSCVGVMRQFLAVYTNVQMEVLYEWP